MSVCRPLRVDACRLQERAEREGLMRLALLRNRVNDAARACALIELHALYLRQLTSENRITRKRARKRFPPLSPAGRGRVLDLRLEDLFKGIGLRIVRSPDPVDAARRLFQPENRRGPKIKNAARDLAVAVDVEKARITAEEARIEAKRAGIEAKEARIGGGKVRTRREKARTEGASLEDVIAAVARSRRRSEDRIRQVYRAQALIHGRPALRLLARSGKAKLEDVRI